MDDSPSRHAGGETSHRVSHGEQPGGPPILVVRVEQSRPGRWRRPPTIRIGVVWIAAGTVLLGGRDGAHRCTVVSSGCGHRLLAALDEDEQSPEGGAQPLPWAAAPTAG
jgi:hypothetical protein